MKKHLKIPVWLLRFNLDGLQNIGNFDQDFVDNWYSNLKQFSVVLMKQIVAYCGKTEQKTQKNIAKCENSS